MIWIKSRNVVILFKSLKYRDFEKSRFFSVLSTSVVTKKDVTSSSLKAKYSPQDTESHWYEWWESQNYFKPKEDGGEPFVVLLPPPNVTGNLHLGHTLTITLQDVILRWKRMKGESVLWIPGIDHAGIATQVVVEKHLQKHLKLSRHDLGREKFLDEIWKWKKEKGNEIINQIRKLGASLDWTKLKFTMDPDHNQLVNNSFIKLYNQGLIYRSKRLINWSCTLKSSISDVEVEWVDIDGRTKLDVPGYDKPVTFGVLYEFAYKIVGEDDEIVIATTRPETMLGDVAVAVNPNDSKYSRFKNKSVWHPFRNEPIPIIFDEFVDTNFGTGAVKITPSHSLIDFEVSLRHNLKSIPVIDEDGCIGEINSVENFTKMKRFDARFEIISKLKDLNLYRGSKEHKLQLPRCSRSGDVVELISKDQWFLKCDAAIEMTAKAVNNGDLKLYPNYHYECLHEWLKNTKDWNLSRQIWWGHQIPMYECSYENEKCWLPALSLEEAKEAASKKFNTKNEISVIRDPDVLDTWFSSGLLPLSISPGSENTPPISLLITGQDILFFWVTRMVMLSLLLTGKLPFKNVILHALVCDSQGRKMSKSLGNVIKPESIIYGSSLEDLNSDLKASFSEGLLTKKELEKALATQKSMFRNGIPECGVDALRMTFCYYKYQGQLLQLDLNLCQGVNFFCNKMWQAMNYYIKVFNSCSERSQLALVKINKDNTTIFDKWILGRLFETITTANKGMEEYNFVEPATSTRNFFVDDFCSIYLESSKKALENASPEQLNTTISILHHCLDSCLRLLSPIMPFLSEHLYHALPAIEGFEKYESVTIAEYPKADEWQEFVDEEINKKFKIILDVRHEIRSIKKFFNLEVSSEVLIECPEDVDFIFSEDITNFITFNCRVSDTKKVSKISPTNLIQRNLKGIGTIYFTHPYDSKTLTKKFEKLLNKEEQITNSLNNLLKEKDSENDSQQLKKINNFQSELEKIRLVKTVIDHCDK